MASFHSFLSVEFAVSKNQHFYQNIEIIRMVH